jgi:hypothetical protein
LAARQPRKADTRHIPLGLEAVDMSIIDKVNQRNASLERVSTFFAPNRRMGSFVEHAETRVQPMLDDENYAAWYYRAYNKKGS